MRNPILQTSPMSSLPVDESSAHSPSLPEAYRSIPIVSGASVWRKMLAFAGPGYLVAVGYMDPGNWATDLGGGSKFGYTLLSVVLLSSLMAIFLQGLSARLGIATGRDLAQACREHYSPRVRIGLWVLCEVAIAACDLAEVLGSAVALKLLFGLPLLAGVLLTGLDVLLVLALQGRGFRWVEAMVIGLIATIAACFAYEIFISQPLWREAAVGLIPTADLLRNRQMLYLSIGILGATVMPHNLYLHSSIVQSARSGHSPTRSAKPSAALFSIRPWRWDFLFSSMPPSWLWAPPYSIAAGLPASQTSVRLTAYSPLRLALGWPAPFSPQSCCIPARTPRLPGHSPARS
jgi:manganese transport protein